MKKLLTLITIIVMIGVFNNLLSNSVYYAKYVPHGENRHPQLEMLADNLWWLDLPIIDGITYDFDGNSSIIKEKDKGVYESYGKIGDNYTYMYDDIGVFLKRNFEIKTVVGEGDKESDKVYNNREIIQNIYNMVQPILDSQKEPIVNLQWIFNLFNYGRFD